MSWAQTDLFRAEAGHADRILEIMELIACDGVSQDSGDERGTWNHINESTNL